MKSNDTLQSVLNVATAMVIALVALVFLFLVLAPDIAARVSGEVMGRIDRRSGETIALATGGRAGGYYAKGRALAEVLERRHSYSLEVVETQGSLENIRRLRNGEVDFALIQGGLPEDMEGLQGVAALDMQFAHIIAPSDASTEGFRDLSGRRVGVGPEDGGSAVLARQIFSFFSFGAPPVLVYDHNADLEQAFLDDEIDAAFLVYSLFSPAVEKLLSTGWYKLIPLRESQAVSSYLYGVSTENIPHSLYGPDRMIPLALTGDIPTVGVKTLLVSRPDVTPRVVRAVLDALYSVDFRRTAHLPDLNEGWGRNIREFTLHAAAEKYYTRNEPVSSDRFEIASFFLAGLIGLVSAVSYISHRRQRIVVAHRRRAILPYFEKLLALRQDAEALDDPDTLMTLAHEMMATQRKAERAWLRGKLDTEHMENLYSVYNFGSRNILNKITNLHLRTLTGDAEQATPPPTDKPVRAWDWDNTPKATPAPREEEAWPDPEAPRETEASSEFDEWMGAQDPAPEASSEEAPPDDVDEWIGVPRPISRPREVAPVDPPEVLSEEASSQTHAVDDIRERSWAATHHSERPAPNLHREHFDASHDANEDEEEDPDGQLDLFSR